MLAKSAISSAAKNDKDEAEKKAQERDIVDLAYQTARKNRICAYAIIAATLTVFVLAAFHQGMQVYQDITKDNRPQTIIINITPDILKEQKKQP